MMTKTGTLWRSNDEQNVFKVHWFFLSSLLSTLLPLLHSPSHCLKWLFLLCLLSTRSCPLLPFILTNTPLFFLLSWLILPSLLPLLILISLSVPPSLHSSRIYFFFTLSLVPLDLLYYPTSTIPTLFLIEILLWNYTTLPLYVLD